MSVCNAGKALVLSAKAELLRAGTRRTVKAVQADVAAQILEDPANAESQPAIVRTDGRRSAFRARAGAEEAVGLAAAADAEGDDTDAAAGAVLVAGTVLAISRAGGAQKLGGRGRDHTCREAEENRCNQRESANHFSHNQCCRSQSVLPC